MGGTESTTRELRVEDVWPQMPRVASGPVWGELIRRAIEYRGEMVADGRDLEDAAYEFADAWVPVYTKDRADLFHKLDLWAVDEVAERMQGDGMTGVDPDGVFSFATLYGGALFYAGYVTMLAVERAIEKVATPHRCDRCQQSYAWDELSPVASPVFDLLCATCADAIRLGVTK